MHEKINHLKTEITVDINALLTPVFAAVDPDKTEQLLSYIPTHFGEPPRGILVVASLHATPSNEKKQYIARYPFLSPKLERYNVKIIGDDGLIVEIDEDDGFSLRYPERNIQKMEKSKMTWILNIWSSIIGDPDNPKTWEIMTAQKEIATYHPDLPFELPHFYQTITGENIHHLEIKGFMYNMRC